jgi:putative restriction endonuclease
MDLIAQGQITENLIEPSFELVDTWNGYWQAVMPPGKTSSMAYPFFFMKSDGFWHLVGKPGLELPDRFRTPSVVWLRQNFSGARLDKELFVLLLDPEIREQLRASVIQTYFAPEVQPKIIEQSVLNFEAEQYKKEILELRQIQTEYGQQDSKQQKEKARSAGFRKAIVSLYEHRCALCGIRMRTPEGHTVVEAAHIVPWSESHDDMPTNGLCLCRLCHWSFDEGLMSVGRKYEVLVSDRVRIDSNMPGHILTLMDRPIFKPEAEPFWPGQENLSRHRKSRFA